ncbi:hypothetical protein PInf_011087 [Phytophthora infestans]|nr:hypothetical protein PInf_011087 [Phytophthora infestans]
MAEVKLGCAVYGEGSVFSVQIERNANVEALQEAIFNKKRYNHEHKFDSSMLTLYLARKKEGEEIKWLKEDDNLDSLLRGEVDKQYVKMRSTWALDEDYFGANFQPGRKEIHVLVKVPETQQTAAAHLMPPVDQGWTARWMSEFHTSQLAPHNLPLVGELGEFIQNELPVKISLHERIRDEWLNRMTTPSSELMAKIFRVANLEPCVAFLYQVGNRVVRIVDPGDTESSFISLWDDLIRHVLNFVGIGKSDRNSSRSASTGSNRPDYLFIVDSPLALKPDCMPSYVRTMPWMQ